MRTTVDEVPATAGRRQWMGLDAWSVLWFDLWCRGALRAHFNRVHVYADAGDAFDLFFKANERNLRIIHDHIGRKHGPREIDGTATRIGER